MISKKPDADAESVESKVEVPPLDLSGTSIKALKFLGIFLVVYLVIVYLLEDVLWNQI
jgi:hypothetical protein